MGWNPLSVVAKAVVGTVNVAGDCAGNIVKGCGNVVGSAVGVVAGKTAGNAVKGVTNVVGNVASAGVKVIGYTGSVGIQGLNCATSAIQEGGNPTKILRNCVGKMVENTSDQICSVLSTATGFNDA